MDENNPIVSSEIHDEIQSAASPSVAATEICFTCFQKTDDFLRIVENDGNSNENPAAIFAQHFWFTKDEYYNQTICKSCWRSIDDFHRFYCQVEKLHPQAEPTKIKIETLGEVETDHEQSLTDDQNQFKCDVCPKAFAEEKLLQSHLLWHVVIKEKNHRCAICDQYFYNAGKLEAHQKVYHVPNVISTLEKVVTISDSESDWEETDPTQFKCKLCTKVFTTEKLLKSHIYWHQVIRKRNHRCKTCDQYFDTVETLEAHRNTNHNPDGKAETEKAAEPVKPTKKNLSKPKKQKQSSQKEIAEQEKLILKFTKFRCSKCDFVAETFLDLKQHGEKKHACTRTVVPVICCGKRYNTRLRLYYHCLTHIDPNHFKCDVCGKVFQESDSLNGHKEFVHAPASERPFKCEVCDATFMKPHMLRQHVKHHNKKLEQLIARKSRTSDEPSASEPVPKKDQIKIEVVNEGEIHIWDQLGPDPGAANEDSNPASDADTDSESDLPLSKFKEILEVKKRKRPDLICYHCHLENPEEKAAFASYFIISKHSRQVHGKKPAMYCSMCDRRFLSEGAFLDDYAKHMGTATRIRSRREILKECLECKLLFKNEDTYKKHMVINHTPEDQKHFKCNLCPKAFPLEDFLKSHLNWHKEVQQKNHHCVKCDLYFPAAGKLKEHNDTNHGPMEESAISEGIVKPPPEPSRYRKFCTPEEIAVQEKLIHKYATLKCEKCAHVAETFAKLRRHYRTEHGLLSLRVFCCERRFGTRCQLYDHCLLHEDPEYFKCKICPKVYQDRARLEIHMWTSHTPISKRPFKCDVCGDAFMKDFLLRTHLNLHLNKELKKYFCKECDRGFSHHFFLQKHMLSVHGGSEDGSFECNICAKQFGNREQLKSHRANHSQKELQSVMVQCDLCQKWYTHQATLEKHKKDSCLAVKSLKCSRCDFEVIGKEAMDEHKKICSPAIVVQCDLCQTRFRRKQALVKHKKHHCSAIKSLKCSRCDFEAIGKEALNEHKKIKHNITITAQQPRKKPRKENKT